MSIFKECDIRGVWGEELNEAMAFRIGYAVALAHPGTFLVGGDVRTSTPMLKPALIGGLRAAGCRVIDLGMVPTPVFYYALDQFEDAVGGVMVTASHNPAQFNGFKFMFGTMPVTPDDMKALEAQVAALPADLPTTPQAALQQYDINEEYLNAMLHLVPPAPPIKIVVDAGNGATCSLAPALLESLGHHVIELFCTFDGSFPNREPNPAVHANLTAIREAVIAEKADLGVAFDGDGDRVVFIDETGQVVGSEAALVILCREYLAEPSSVVFDIKSSSLLSNEVTRMGSTPIKIGRAHV